MSDKKLRKSNKNRMLAGVCSGIADFFGVDPTIIRLIFIILGLIKGLGILLYVICVFVMPADFNDIDEDEADDVEKITAKENKGKVKKAPHTDEEFDSYFSNK